MENNALYSVGLQKFSSTYKRANEIERKSRTKVWNGAFVQE